MLSFKGMRFPIDVILVCIRWYAASFVAQFSLYSVLAWAPGKLMV